MKTFLSIIIVGISFFLGCSDKENIIAPENDQTSGPNWITLPQRNGSSVETEYSVTQQIDGSLGGKLEISDIYFAGPQGVVKVKATLKFPQNCFTGIETITMTADNVNGTIIYSPPMNFNIPALLDLEYQGIDLTGVEPDSVDFVYQDPDGSYDSMEYDKIQVIMAIGKLMLKDGKIPHFSRYGFSR